MLNDSGPKTASHRSKMTPWVKSMTSHLMKSLSTLKSKSQKDQTEFEEKIQEGILPTTEILRSIQNSRFPETMVKESKQQTVMNKKRSFPVSSSIVFTNTDRIQESAFEFKPNFFIAVIIDKFKIKHT